MPAGPGNGKPVAGISPASPKRAGSCRPTRNALPAGFREGKARYYGEGSWYAIDGGKVCMNARWGGKRSSSHAINCFLHREKDGVIYQKPTIGGKWYVFRHNPCRNTMKCSG
jgi:hypothetical protein